MVSAATTSGKSPAIRTLQHDVAAMKTRIEQLQLHEIAPLTHRLTELESIDVALLGERMDGVEDSETDLDSRMKGVEAHVAKTKASGKDFTADIASINSRLRGLQDVISSANNSTNLAKATADDALETAEDVTTSMREFALSVNGRIS